MTRAPGEARPRRRGAVWALMIATLFLAGPTPGDVGGCGGSLAGTALPGDPDQSQYDYFEQGLCANLCLRLRSCGVLCRSLQTPGPNCSDDSLAAYQQCLRGNIRADVFGSNMCPRSCGNYRLTYRGASEQDVVVCGAAVQAVRCEDIHLTIRQPPLQCLAVCGE